MARKTAIFWYVFGGEGQGTFIVAPLGESPDDVGPSAIGVASVQGTITVQN